MKILFVAGGTAGHINPAIAIANEFKEQLKDVSISFAGTPFGMEAELVAKANYSFHPISVKGFKRNLTVKNILRNFKAIFLLSTSLLRAKKILKIVKPDLVFGTGGYASAPILFVANKLKIKTAIHEQNAYPGMTNKFLAKRADIVFLAVKEAQLKLPPCIHFVVGNPIRKSILKLSKKEAKKQLGLDDSFCILTFGGSLGAVKINEIAADLMQWHVNSNSVNHIHALGKLGINCFPKMLKQRKISVENNKRIILQKYIHNMNVCLAAADLVICRAGALTIAELQATATTSILIPSPNVSENHQFHNALVLQKNHAAVLIKEDEYEKNKLISIVKSFINNPKKLETFSQNAKKMAILNTTQLIYDHVMEIFKN